MRKRHILAAAFVAGAAAVGINLVQGSAPAAPTEIRDGIAALPDECRDLARARILTHIAQDGALSRRQLGVWLNQECRVAGEQWRAAGGGTGEDVLVE